MSEHKIFISYRNGLQDGIAEQVNAIWESLKAHHYDVWMDKADLIPGQDWEKQIHAAISQCDAVLLVMAKNTTQSAQVRREIEYAIDMKRNIIPVLDAAVDYQRELKHLPQALCTKLSHQPTLRLQPDSFEAGLHALLRAVKDQIAPMPAPKTKDNPAKSPQFSVPEAVKPKLQEDNLYTVLYAYVRTFAPTQNYMVYDPKQQSAAELEKSAYRIAKALQKQHHIDLTPVVDDIVLLVGKKQYNEAKRYILERVHKVEEEIKDLQ